MSRSAFWPAVKILGRDEAERLVEAASGAALDVVLAEGVDDHLANAGELMG